jgi:hypothetical protein
LQLPALRVRERQARKAALPIYSGKFSNFLDIYLYQPKLDREGVQWSSIDVAVVVVVDRFCFQMILLLKRNLLL